MKINGSQKPEVSWLVSETLNQRRGLTNVLAGHQAGDPCIRSCHSHYGMWHSVAPAPVAWCILMSKMLWVRVTLHGWYRTEKPPSITRAVWGNVTVNWFFGDSPCPRRSCTLTFHVSTSRGWLTCHLFLCKVRFFSTGPCNWERKKRFLLRWRALNSLSREGSPT